MSLPFLADESCDFGVVRALRSAGFQVTAVSEVASGADDNVVIDLANREKKHTDHGRQRFRATRLCLRA